MTGKKLCLLALALLLLPLAHLRPCCRVTVQGRTLEGSYSPAQLRRAQALARETAEELLEQEAGELAVGCRWRLSLRRADGDARQLCDALLRACPGIVLAEGVSVNGVQLGTVENGEALLARLRGAIREQMPDSAVYGSISGQLHIRPVYSRAGHETDADEMLLRICAAAPVVYLDKDGRLA